MDFVTGCRLAPAGPSSAHAAGRDANASPSDIEPLRRSTEFRSVLAKGQRRRRGGVTVVGVTGPSGRVRVGLVTRTVGGAVERNRIKRRLRHALKEISLEQGMDYVIIGDRRVFDAPFTTVTEWLGAAVGELR